MVIIRSVAIVGTETIAQPVSVSIHFACDGRLNGVTVGKTVVVGVVVAVERVRCSRRGVTPSVVVIVAEAVKVVVVPWKAVHEGKLCCNNNGTQCHNNS